jgi:hypothetical protein
VPSSFYVNHDPDKEFLRYGTVVRWLTAKGFSVYQVKKLRENGTIKVAAKFTGCLTPWFSRDQIKRDILDNPPK